MQIAQWNKSLWGTKSQISSYVSLCYGMMASALLLLSEGSGGENLLCLCVL